MARYFRLLLVRLRVSVQLGSQYRSDFLVGGVMALFWLSWNLVPMWVVWQKRPMIAGWSFPEALLVAAWFTLMRGVLEGAVQPSLVAVVEHIRQGTLDFVLLKPADAQFLVSTAKFESWRAADAIGALVIGGYALHRVAHPPAASAIAVALLLTLAGAAVLYAVAIVVVAAAFWVVRLDNLIYLFNSIFDAARWPLTVFRGFWRILFTFIIPLGLITTYPAMALLNKLDWPTALRALGGAMLFVALARVAWTRALKHYTSASS